MTDVTFDDAALEFLTHNPEGPVGRDLQRRAVAVETAAKRLLSLPGTGRVYTTAFYTASDGTVHPVGHRPAHQASAPGQPPAVDTGLLRASIRNETGVEGADLAAYVGSDVKYSVYLELGTHKMAPRPFLTPALEAARL